MVQLILIAVAIYAVEYLIGLPWALWLRHLPGEYTPPVWLVSPLIGQLIIGLGWVWGFGFAGGFLVATIFMFALSIAGWFILSINLSSRRTKSVLPNFAFSNTAKILIVVIIVLTLASRSQPSLYQTAYPTRIGPDLVAYTTSSRIIVDDMTFSNLEARLEQENRTTLDELFSSSSNKNVYSIPSFPDQTAAEILLGALRWGVVGLIAELKMIGLTANIFGITNALTLLNVLFALGLLLKVFTRPNSSFSLHLFGSLIFVSSPSIVVAYLDGFIAQTIALPYIVLTCVGLFAIFDSRNRFSISKTVLFLIGLSGLSVFYFDSLLMIGPVIAIALIIGRRNFARNIQRLNRVELMTLLAVSGFSLVCLTPLLIKIPHWLIKRFAESKTNGYWQPSWISVVELLGFSTKGWRISGAWNAVSGFSMSLEKQAVLWCISIALLILIFRSVKSEHKIVLSAFGIILCSIFVMDTHLNLSNFRFFKVMSYGFPIVWICFIEFYQKYSERISEFGRMIRAFSRVFAILMMLQLLVQIRPDSNSFNPPYYLAGVMKDASTVKAQKILTKSNVIGPGNHILMGSIAASSELFWMDRGFQGISTNFENRSHLPLYWAVFKDSDQPFQCLIKAVGVRTDDFVTGDFALLRLSNETVKKSNIYLDDFLKDYASGPDFATCTQNGAS